MYFWTPFVSSAIDNKHGNLSYKTEHPRQEINNISSENIKRLVLGKYQKEGYFLGFRIWLFHLEVTGMIFCYDFDGDSQCFSLSKPASKWSVGMKVKTYLWS